MHLTIETSIFNVNGDSLRGPLIIGTFKKRAPGPFSFLKWRIEVGAIKTELGKNNNIISSFS